MTDEVTEPKTHLALDTDWMTALFTAACFVLCLLFSVATVRQVLIAAPVKVHVTWDTWFLFLGSAWFAIQVKERRARLGCILLSIVFGSRLVLMLVHASFQIQILNAEIMRVVEVLVEVGIYCYLANWFKQRTRRV